jgi:hypothetical protein
MARMTRTQVTLEESEYRFLKARAAESGSSFSSIVRSLIRERMQQAAADAPHVWDVAGVISESAFSGEHHDAIIYGGEPGTSDRGTGGTGPTDDGA